MHFCAPSEKIPGDEFQVWHPSQVTCPATQKYQKSDKSTVFTDVDIYLWDSISINQMAMNKTLFNSAGIQFQLQK